MIYHHIFALHAFTSASMHDSDRGKYVNRHLNKLFEMLSHIRAQPYLFAECLCGFKFFFLIKVDGNLCEFQLNSLWASLYLFYHLPRKSALQLLCEHDPPEIHIERDRSIVISLFRNILSTSYSSTAAASRFPQKSLSERNLPSPQWVVPHLAVVQRYHRMYIR